MAGTKHEPQKYQINLRSLRENIGLKQKEIAAQLGIRQTVYSRYERGENDMKPFQLVELCNFYRVSADYLLDLPEGRPYGNNTVRLKNIPISKFDKLGDECKDLILWAEEQGHISSEASDILFENLNAIITELQGGRK